MLNIQPGYKILDVGCGQGRHTCEASRFENVTVFGVDICSKDIAEANKRLKIHKDVGEHGGGHSTTLVGDIKNLPFENGFFDIVICSEVLEHIPEQETAVSEIVRVLKPGGNLVVSVPRFWPERICWALSDSYHNTAGGHVRIYKKKKLVKLLETAGVRNWAAHFAHGLHSPYWWLKCLVGPEKEDSQVVNLYHRLLVWDMMKQPRLTRLLERFLNPLMGKSIVLYLRRQQNA
jgi:2-polyprenyl-3-methyl-5-hydroxy-6-metoxy-1,4-benzoquinol methylase